MKTLEADTIVAPTMVPEIVALKGDTVVVKCESGEDWTNLPYRTVIQGEECTKDTWNSIEQTAIYQLVN